ncbi:MAG TPA: hypothetical protein VFA74_14490 [Terriglobales bacterium]|nr:hypothetical protein [Terriglobales bacterium]
MRKTKHNAGYNAPNPYMLVSPLRIARGWVFLLLCLLQITLLSATDWRSAEKELTGKIASITGPGAVAVDLANRSSLASADVDQIHRALLTELATVGVRAVNSDQAAATVHVSLSENMQNYVWVAEIHQGADENSVVIVTMPRPLASTKIDQEATMTIHKVLLWSQSNRILDVALVSGSPQHMIILDPGNLTIYNSQNGHWQQELALPIEHSQPWPRDLRGRLVLRKDHLFDAFLPGTFCRSTTRVPLAMNCYASDDPWPLATTEQPGLSAFFASTRNFFTGALSPGIGKQTATSAFYSAAALPREKYTLWLLAGVDGKVHFLDGVTDQPQSHLRWGSDIANLHSSCGSGWQVLSTGNANSTSDTAQAFEIPDREPIAVSQPMEFSGNIAALWTSSDGNGVIAVSHNSETGLYEAFLLTISCSQ